MEHFKIATANRRQFDCQNSCALSAVNAVCLAKDMAWEDAYRLLLNQSHRYGLMPEDERCIRNMLTEAGYVHIKPLGRMDSYEALSQYLTEHYPLTPSALIMTVRGQTGRKRIQAVRPSDEPGGGFVALATKKEQRSVTRLWVPYEVTGAEKPIPEPPFALRQSRPVPEHEGYRYFQPNPRGNSIGDCVIRAYAAVFNVTWDEALEMVARANGYLTTILNSLLTDRYLVSEHGFAFHEPPDLHGEPLTGREFCGFLTRKYHGGERVFAEMGTRHVVGIVPVDTAGGPRYAIMDSWDSSREKIGRYFVYTPVKEQGEEAPPARAPLVITEGTHVKHPRYGEGVTEAVKGDRIDIRFLGAGLKTLALSWVREHCG